MKFLARKTWARKEWWQELNKGSPAQPRTQDPWERGWPLLVNAINMASYMASTFPFQAYLSLLERIQYQYLLLSICTEKYWEIANEYKWYELSNYKYPLNCNICFMKMTVLNLDSQIMKIYFNFFHISVDFKFKKGQTASLVQKPYFVAFIWQSLPESQLHFNLPITLRAIQETSCN
jgi:hypothetical protein